MRESIVARVKWNAEDPFKPLILVRKAVFNDEGFLEKKYGLTGTGEWVEVPRDIKYPEECLLPVEILHSSPDGVRE